MYKDKLFFVYVGDFSTSFVEKRTTQVININSLASISLGEDNKTIEFTLIIDKIDMNDFFIWEFHTKQETERVFKELLTFLREWDFMQRETIND